MQAAIESSHIVVGYATDNDIAIPGLRSFTTTDIKARGDRFSKFHMSRVMVNFAFGMPEKGGSNIFYSVYLYLNGKKWPQV